MEIRETYAAWAARIFEEHPEHHVRIHAIHSSVGPVSAIARYLDAEADDIIAVWPSHIRKEAA